VRVTFVRGPRRVVVGVDSSPLGGVYGLVHAVCGVLGVSLFEVSDDVGDGEVVDVGTSMSVVAGGLVLVIVAVVVGVGDCVACGENDGSTKVDGGGSGWLNWRVTNITAAMRMPMTARPATLAPMTLGVRLYHGTGDGG
jgi:hypothetical protein